MTDREKDFFVQHYTSLEADVRIEQLRHRAPSDPLSLREDLLTVTGDRKLADKAAADSLAAQTRARLR